jgi:uncharacterized Zn-finger protein
MTRSTSMSTSTEVDSPSSNLSPLPSPAYRNFDFDNAGDDRHSNLDEFLHLGEWDVTGPLFNEDKPQSLASNFRLDERLNTGLNVTRRRHPKSKTDKRRHNKAPKSAANPDEVRPYKCKKCLAAFSTKKDQLRHEFSCWRGIKFECTESGCHSILSRKDGVLRHGRKFHGWPDKK